MSRNSNYDELFNNDAFKNVDPNKVEIAKQMAQNLQGKSEQEVLQTIMHMASQMQSSGGTPMSRAEQRAMIEAMRSTLPQEQQKKFDAMVRMMEMMMGM